MATVPAEVWTELLRNQMKTSSAFAATPSSCNVALREVSTCSAPSPSRVVPGEPSTRNVSAPVGKSTGASVAEASIGPARSWRLSLPRPATTAASRVTNPWPVVRLDTGQTVQPLRLASAVPP